MADQRCEFESRRLAVTRHAARTCPSARRWLALTLIAALSFSAWTAAALARGAIHHQSSDNWAGYADTARRPLVTVSGSWTQPPATCDQPFPTYSAFWVGLGGLKPASHGLEQIGTEADCTKPGTPNAFAWYEILPAPPVKLRLAIHRGDQLTARVSIRGRRARLQIENLTTHRGVTRTVKMRSPDTTSAEWIAEAPSECVTPTQCRPLPLTDFGTVSFTSASAAPLHAPAAPITDPAFTSIELTLTSGAPTTGPMPVRLTRTTGAAAPGELSASGSAFTVTVQPPAAPPGPPPPIAAPNRLRHHRIAAAISKLGLDR